VKRITGKRGVDAWCEHVGVRDVPKVWNRWRPAGGS